MEHDSHLTILLDIQKQLGTLGADIAGQKETLKLLPDLNKRVGKLEDAENYRAGKMTVIGAVVGGVASFIVNFLLKRL